MIFSSDRKRSPEGFVYRPLRKADVDEAIAIVDAHDDDDAEEAAYALSGDLSGFYGVEADGVLAGFTGYERILDAPTSAWLSWTYVRADMRKRGIGAFMLESCDFHSRKQKLNASI